MRQNAPDFREETESKMRWRSLTKQSQFQKVYREGVKRIGRLLVVYLLPANEYARGIVASRKVGGAVQRNRGKRLLREAMIAGLPGRPEWVQAVSAGLAARTLRQDSEQHHDTGGDAPDQDDTAGLWMVLVARRKILEAGAQDVRTELDSLLRDLFPEED